MKSTKIGVVGLGYVGLTFAISLAKRGFKVNGYENNLNTFKLLSSGKAQFYEENIDIGNASKCWLEKSLECLDNELAKLDSKLYVFKGNSKKIIDRIKPAKNEKIPINKTFIAFVVSNIS